MEADLSETNDKIDKLSKDCLVLKKERDEARQKIYSFQRALDERTREKNQIHVEKVKSELVVDKTAKGND